MCVCVRERETVEVQLSGGGAGGVSGLHSSACQYISRCSHRCILKLTFSNIGRDKVWICVGVVGSLCVSDVRTKMEVQAGGSVAGPRHVWRCHGVCQCSGHTHHRKNLRCACDSGGDGTRVSGPGASLRTSWSRVIYSG